MTGKTRETLEVTFTYPSYGDLPDELMFVDDMVAFVNKVHASLPQRVRRGKVFTRAMATNYVKGGLTPPAVGRRYTRDHLALILFAATAKLCFSAEEVYWLAGELFEADNIPSSHDSLKYAFDRAFAGTRGNSRADAVASNLVDRICALSEASGA